jgi:hypothetical protein
MTTTITEALAELKLIKSKIEKKTGFIVQYLGRQEGAKDPLEKQGGCAKAIAEEMQAIGDLHERFVNIRSAIAARNAAVNVTIGTTSRSVADWLVWRRDVAPLVKGLQKGLQDKINQIRNGAKAQGWSVVKAGEPTAQPTDVIIEIDEKALAERSEATQEVLDTLDGKLSLHNATQTVEV